MAAAESQSSGPPQMIQIFEETEPDHWKECGSDLTVLEHKQDRNIVVFLSKEFTEKDTPHERYKDTFQDEFRPVIDDDINGSFHCEYVCEGDRAWPAVSWSCFKIKDVSTAKKYSWKQPTIHVKWDQHTGRQLIHVIESPLAPGEFRLQVPLAQERRCNPFAWHAAFAHMVLKQYDGAFWLLRDLVRAQEKARNKKIDPKDEKKSTARKLADKHQRHTKPNDFPLLHDILRHLFHYQEIIEVAIHTLQVMTEEHTRWRKDDGEHIQKNLGSWINSRQRILHEHKRAHSLKMRSKSLNDRHQNEINLAFNLVSQGFGRDARSDSNMMKTVAVVSMVYLPGTFVSGLFGTNFFSFQADPGNTWLMAKEFWLYWAVTLPLTLLTMVVWAVWHYQETWTDWWEAVVKKRSEKTSSPGAGLAFSGIDEKTGISFHMQRITTALRLGEVQRHETV
ncbi:hypothetical protein BDV18DRAFT_142408 [Aspergillus unguis]